MADLLESIEDGVAVLTLNRPEALNALSMALIHDLGAHIDEVAKSDTRALIITGAGPRAFCAGADLNWMRAMADFSWEQNRADAQKLADMLWTLDQCPVPIVGRVQGDCYAGGMGLAAVCDVVVAADSATFCLSEARLGLLPGTISPYVMRALGVQASRRYMVTAERFSAAQAQGHGFVHTLCAPEQLDSEVAALVATLVANGPLATRACKLLVRDVSAPPMSQALRADTARRIADIRASDEGKEGLQSFLHKRPPAWLV